MLIDEWIIKFKTYSQLAQLNQGQLIDIIEQNIDPTVTLALPRPYIICHTRGSNSQPHYDNSHYQLLHSLSYCNAPGLDPRTALWLSTSCLPHARSFTMHIAQPRI